MGLLSLLESGLTKVSNVVGSIYKATLAKVPLVPQIKAFVEKNPEVAIGLGAGTAIKSAVTAPFLKSVPSTLFAAATATPKTALISSAGAIVGGSAFFQNPEKTLSSAVNAPKAAVNFLSNVGQFFAEPSIEKAKDIVEENPKTAAVAAAVGGAVLFKGAGGAIIAAKILDTNNNGETPQDTQGLVLPTEKPQTYATNEGKPITPELTTVTTGAKKRYKRRTATKPQVISQRVNLIISNKNQTVGMLNKRYIKEYAY